MNKEIIFLLLFTLLFLFSGSVYGVEPEVKKEYWRNGKLRSETHYKLGKIEGRETWFYRTGEKLEEVPGQNGKKEGLEKWWYKNGRKKSIKHYKKGLLDGMVTE
jgi:antitoxin component YwqK of YwqJK toxin-antitoxin module